MPQRTNSGWRSPLGPDASLYIDGRSASGLFITGGGGRFPRQVYLHYSGLEDMPKVYMFELPNDRASLLELAETIRSFAMDERHIRW